MIIQKWNGLSHQTLVQQLTVYINGEGVNQVIIPRVFALCHGVLYRVDLRVGRSFYCSCVDWAHEQLINRDFLMDITREACTFFNGAAAELLNIFFHSPRRDPRDFCDLETNLSNYRDIVAHVPAHLWSEIESNGTDSR